MTDLHPNAEVVMKGFQAFAEGDVATMRGIFTDDAVWHAGGRNRWTGDYTGIDEILGFFGEIAGAASLEQDIHALFADDDHAVALVNSKATRDDTSLESNLVFIFHVSDGKASEVWATSLDDYAADEFWGS